jgi:dynein heavy chain
MVLLESDTLGYAIYIQSYCNDLRTFVDERIVDKFEKYFHYLADVCVAFTHRNGKFPCPGTGPYIINHMIRLIECYVAEYRPPAVEDDDDEFKLPQDMDDKLSNALMFGCVWGIGGCLDEFTRPRFDEFLQKVITGEDVVADYSLDVEKELDPETPYEAIKVPTKIGDYKSVFDLYFDAEEMRWTNWMNTVEKYTINREETYLMLSIPTMDQIRMNHICKTLLKKDKHCLFVGPTGTGKSVSVSQLLKQEFENEDWVYFALGFSAQTSANQTERIIDGKMEKQRKGVYGPKGSKQGVIFVDDLSMPLKQRYGAQPPIELLRQWMDYQGWYDIDSPEREYLRLQTCASAQP